MTFFSKINVDAATSRSHERGASAAICRDDQERYLGASVTVYEGLVEPESLEAHACCKAFSLVADLHIGRIRVATDLHCYCYPFEDHIHGSLSANYQRYSEEDVAM